MPDGELDAARENKMKIGFAGLGAMGGPMAGHLLEAGHKLLVLTRCRESAGAARREGCDLG